jgi:DNA-binding NarL/FixJ family response regulator
VIDEDDVDPGLDPQLMALLSAGLKDDAIARQLHVSSRTVGRRVADLMADLGARTRFQAGLFVQRRARHTNSED